MGEYQLDQYTVSLLHFNDGAKDETGRVWMSTGGARISTAQSKYGGNSLYLNGTSQYLTTVNTSDFDFGSGDFTVDWWEYRTSATLGQTVFNRNVSAGNAHSPFKIGHSEQTGVINVWMSSNAANLTYDIANAKSMGTAILNHWVHYAVVRSGNTFFTFQNGILISTWTSSLSIAVLDTAPSIGGNGQYYFGGYIDEFRISKGIARWTSDFDPESPPQTPTGHGLLRITMNDSSEREYRLSTTEIENFIKWYDRTVGTGNTCYPFDDIVDLSKEYLSFEKIISFKVIPLKD